MADNLPQNTPQVDVEIRLTDALQALLAPEGRVATLVKAVEHDVCQTMDELGIPGRAVPRVTFAADGTGDAKWLTVRVAGELVSYFEPLLWCVKGYVTGALLQVEEVSALLAWVESLFSQGAAQSALDFLARSSVEIAKGRPALLFGLPQAAALSEQLSPLADPQSPLPDPWPPRPETILAIAGPVLDLRISLADRHLVAQTLQVGLQAGRTTADITEDLAAACAPDKLEILMPPSDLRQFTTTWAEKGQEQFPLLLDDLFEETGVVLPDLHLGAREDKPGTFAFRIGSLLVCPFVGFAVDECLVDGRPEMFAALTKETRPALNPDTGLDGTVMPAKFQGAVEAAGLVAWDQLGYLVLCAKRVCRDYAWALMNRRVAEDALRELNQAFPELVAQMPLALTPEDLTRVLRVLLDERISVRDLRTILELALDYASQPSSGDVLSFIRQGLATLVKPEPAAA